MPFTLEQVVPWGRTFDEYTAMFTLTADDLRGKILGCGDGPASFNTTAAQQGIRVFSCDPIYQFSAQAIDSRVQATYDRIMHELRENSGQFVWTRFATPEDVGRERLGAMRAFVTDFARSPGRYHAALLPDLPYAADSFDLALCSHLLFLYSGQLSLALHLQSVRELCRVAREVRIFPLLALDARPSPHLEPVTAALRESGFTVDIVPVDYEFQRGGNQMLRIRR